MEISLIGQGLLSPGQLQPFLLRTQLRNIKAVRAGMVSVTPRIKTLVRSNAERAFKVKRKSFLNIFTTKIWDKDKLRLPDFQVYASKRVPWIGIHETGGTVTGNMIIPLLPDKRISRKRFGAFLSELRAKGLLFFRKEGDRTLVFAESPDRKDSVRGLASFKKAQRAKTGAKTVKRGADVLIGIIVKRVQIPAKLHFKATARKAGPILATAIKAQLNG
jgi:hypothetical protein